MDWIHLAFDTVGFTPRWASGGWTPLHGWVHIVADLATWAAYFAIPVLLIYFVRKHPDVPYPRFFWLFGTFILACGTVHLVEASLFWWPWYRLSAIVKVITALTSWAAVVTMVPTLPKALLLPGLREMVDQLEQDVAERKRQEQRLRDYAEELERRNKELDDFTYIASHDLQEPLRKLVSFSELLTQDLDRNDRVQAAKDLAYITDSACRMRKLIHDLLALSRAARNEIKCESLALRDCVDAAIRSLDLLIVEKQAELTIDPLPGVVGDRTLLTQLFQNLLNNALKFVPAGRSPRMRITAHEEADGWVFGVKDNGIGIDQEYHTQIFGAFKRLHGASEYDGNGIGLAICERAVARHGGRIWVESTGEGAHFKFTLGNVRDATCSSGTAADPSYSSSRMIPAIRS